MSVFIPVTTGTGTGLHITMFFLFFVNKKIHKNVEVKLFVQIPSNLIEMSVYSSYWSITTPGAK